jgi:hypothetical protein
MTLRRSKKYWSKKVGGIDPDAWIMTFALTASDSITLPLVNSGVFNFVVDWGDGTSDTITAFNQAERIHSYAGQPAGDYVVTITGTCPGWGFGPVPASRAKLKTIDQWGDVGLALLNQGFTNCSNFVSMPSTGFKYSGASMLQAFQGTKITPASLSSSFFANATSVTNITYLFLACSTLTSIPAGLLDPLTGLTVAFGAFQSTPITSIPTDLFRFNTSVNNFTQCFQACTSLTSLPVDIFRYNTGVTTFLSAFNGCTNLTTLPVDLFRYNTGVTTFQSTFEGCASLSSLPAGIFQYNTSVNTFTFTFRNCIALTSLPVDIFRYNTSVTIFQQCLQGTRITSSMDPDLFRYNTLVNNVGFVFALNPALATVPAGIFQYNTAITQAGGIFWGCTGFNSIPVDLFRFNINITNFGGFNGGGGVFNNTAITSIPVDLFRYNTSANNFGSAFGTCGFLTSVPVDLFRYNTGVTTFLQCFSGCANLASVPTDLFNCFSGCDNLGTSVTSIVSGMTMTACTTTNQMFNSCTSLTGNGQDLIDKPKAAGYTVGTASNTGSYRTFFNCAALTDFATISANYK